MGNRSAFGSASALVPPITVGGVAYGLALRFSPSPEEGEAHEVVTGHVDRVEALGGGRWRVICRRAMVTCSYTRPQLEVLYECLCGGNVASAPEPLRIYSWANPDAVRGDLAGRRAIAGDALWFGPPGGEEAAFIEEAIAFGQPAAVVNYAGDAPRPTVSYAALDWLDLFLPQPTAEREANPAAAVDLTLSGPWYGGNGALFVRAAAEDPYTALTRRAFGVDQPELYPADAELALGEYWLGGESLRLRVSSHNEALGDQLLASWWEGPFDVLTPAGGRAMVLEGAGAGYDAAGTADERVAFLAPAVADFEEAFLLLADALGNFGAAALEVDFPEAGRCAALLWSGNAVSALLARTADGGGMEPQPFAETTLSGSVATLTVRKVGGTVSFLLGTDLIGEVDFGAAVPAVAFGRVGVAAFAGGACKWYGPEGREVARHGTGGRLHRLNFREWSGIAYRKDIALPAGTAIESAVGRAYGPYSAAGSPRRRNHYSRTGDVLTFWSETVGDVVRIRQAAAGTAPAPPGRCPRPGSAIVNFATVDPESGEAFLPTLNPAEQLANGHDVLVVRVPGSRAPAAGDPFTVRRNVALDPREPWTLRFAVKGDPGADWSVLASSAAPGADVLPRLPEGVFLVRQSWLEALAGARPCFALDATFIEHRANLDARTVNELAAGVEALEGLHFEVGVSGTSVQVAGWMEAARMVNSGWECHSWRCVGNSSGLTAGVTREAWNYDPASVQGRLGNIAERAGGLPGVLALMSTGGPGLVMVDSLSGEFFTTADYTDVECCTGLPAWNTKSLPTQGRRMYLWPYDNGAGIGFVPSDFPLLDNGFGADLEPPGAGGGVGYSVGPTMFRFAGLGFDIPPQLRRAPKGTTVVSAFLLCRFSGVQNRVWSISESGHWPRNAEAALSFPFEETRHHVTTINGVEVLRIEPGEGGPIVTTNPEPPSVQTAAVTFVAVGRRLDSRPLLANLNVASQLLTWETADPPHAPTEAEVAALHAASTFAVPRTGSGWQAFASIQTPTVVEDGKWTSVNVTGAVGALLAARESACVQFQLFPGQGVSQLSTAPGGLRDYLAGLDPAVAVSSVNLDDDRHEYTFEASGQVTRWEQLEVASLQIQIRFPAGILETYRLPPLPRGPMMA